MDLTLEDTLSEGNDETAPPTTEDTIDLTGSDKEDAHLFHLRDKEISKSWVLLDNYSTVNVFSNPDLLTNIRPDKKRMRIYC